MRLSRFYQIIDEIQAEKGIKTSDIEIEIIGQTIVLYKGEDVIGEVNV